MKKLQKALGCLFLLTVFFCQPVFADTPLLKLTRGISNTFSGMGEYAVHGQKQMSKLGPVTGFFGSLIYGTYYAVIRTAAGVYETVTFLIPFPKNYESVIEPATLF